MYCGFLFVGLQSGTMESQFPKFRDSWKIAGKNGKGRNRKKQNGEQTVEPSRASNRSTGKPGERRESKFGY